MKKRKPNTSEKMKDEIEGQGCKVTFQKAFERELYSGTN